MMLGRIGLLPIGSLDTGGGSTPGIAERVLDDVELRVQARGWHYNMRRNQELSPVLFTFSNAGWTNATKTLTQNGAFVDATVGQTIEITGGTGVTAGSYIVTGIDSTNGHYVVLDTDISTGGDVANGISGEATNNKIAVPAGTIWLDNDECREWRDITQLGGRIVDKTSGENTDLFTDSVVCLVCYRYSFECIVMPIRQYIATEAAREFVDQYGPQFMRENIWQTRLRLCREEAARARAEANKFDCDARDINLLETAESLRVKGWRSGDANGYVPGWVDA